MLQPKAGLRVGGAQLKAREAAEAAATAAPPPPQGTSENASKGLSEAATSVPGEDSRSTAVDTQASEGGASGSAPLGKPASGSSAFRPGLQLRKRGAVGEWASHC